MHNIGQVFNYLHDSVCLSYNNVTFIRRFRVFIILLPIIRNGFLSIKLATCK